MRIQPVAYQDDVARASSSVAEVQAGMTKMSAMLKDKGLEAHPDKTCFIVIGSSEFKSKVYDDIKMSPLTFGNFEVKEKLVDTYHGQMLHSEGLGKSAEATVEERSGRIKGAAMEIPDASDGRTHGSMGIMGESPHPIITQWIRNMDRGNKESRGNG